VINIIKHWPCLNEGFALLVPQTFDRSRLFTRSCQTLDSCAQHATILHITKGGTMTLKEALLIQREKASLRGDVVLVMRINKLLAKFC